MRIYLFIFLLIISAGACRKDPGKDPVRDLTVDSVFVNNVFVPNNSTVNNVAFENTEFRIRFSSKVDTSDFNPSRVFFSGGITDIDYHFADNQTNLFVNPGNSLSPLSSYRFTFDPGPNFGTRVENSYSFIFRTQPDSTPKFPPVADEDLLTLVQQTTFRYFWDYGHPVSGLARERYGSGELVTTGGSGFGMMAILVGIERNFITRQQGFDRIDKIVKFLSRPQTDRSHGAFPHWMNGTTGDVIPFGTVDNGGDLVETAYLMQGLLTARQYFSTGSAPERALADSITILWEDVEWDWYRRNSENVLYWHWSPTYNWQINHQIRGWNEAMIVYVLAASSPSHSIPPEVYHQGWARNGAYPMKNGKTFYDTVLPLGEDYGGPLFFAHYSFLGLDPSRMTDQYADYWQQNVAHAKINYLYAVDNPKDYAGYSEDSWGLTASDIQSGYTASSPTNDRGVIAPTAALSSFPYTPEESMKALKFFYYVLGDKLWGEYGFYDAYNLTTNWFADSYLAIDQGPVICMIENYRSGLLWDLFMSSPEVLNGLNRLSITVSP